MELKWIQEPRFAAQGEAGKFYRVFPFSDGRFGASITYLDETGNMATHPIGTTYDTADEAKTACTTAFSKRSAKQ